MPGRTGENGGIELHYRKSAVLRENDSYWDKPLEPVKGHARSLDLFADALFNGTPSPCDEIDGARATCMALKVLESIRRNEPVDIVGEEYFLPRRRTNFAALS